MCAKGLLHGVLPAAAALKLPRRGSTLEHASRVVAAARPVGYRQPTLAAAAWRLSKILIAGGHNERAASGACAALGSNSGGEGSGGSGHLALGANNCVPAGEFVGSSLAPQPMAVAAASSQPDTRAGSRDVSAAAAAVAEAPPAPPPLVPGSAGASLDRIDLDLPRLSLSSLDSEEEGEGASAHASGSHGLSHDDIDQAVHEAFEHELENINQAVHAAFELEKVQLDMQLEQVQEQMNETVQQAVENALLDRSFDIRANLNTMVALIGVILFWRGIWNLLDSWLGTDNFEGNVGSVLIGLSVMLLFRMFKIPLAEFW